MLGFRQDEFLLFKCASYLSLDFRLYQFWHLLVRLITWWKLGGVWFVLQFADLSRHFWWTQCQKYRKWKPNQFWCFLHWALHRVRDLLPADGSFCSNMNLLDLVPVIVLDKCCFSLFSFTLLQAKDTISKLTEDRKFTAQERDGLQRELVFSFIPIWFKKDFFNIINIRSRHQLKSSKVGMLSLLNLYWVNDSQNVASVQSPF